MIVGTVVKHFQRGYGLVVETEGLPEDTVRVAFFETHGHRVHGTHNPTRNTVNVDVEPMVHVMPVAELEACS